jgi:DOPA 4,5-dioxygenase
MLSALVHPNCEDGDAVRDHSQRATWLGERVMLDLGLLKKFTDKQKQEQTTSQSK